MWDYPYVPPEGRKDAPILILGEAPGAEEVAANRPFVGASGRLLFQTLAKLGVKREDCYITNVCKFRPPGNNIAAFFEHTKTRARKLKMMEVCGRYPKDIILQQLDELRAELQQVKPKVVIALGATALWALVGENKISAWRGSVLLPSECKGAVRPPAIVVPTYHPAAVLRQNDWQPVFASDLRRALRVATNGFSPPRYTFTLAPSFEAVVGHLRALERGQWIAVDIETVNHQVSCIGIAWSDTEAICIPFHRADGSNYFSEAEEFAVWRELRRVLSECRIIGQNFSYDAQYLAQLGVPPKCDFDTMIAHHVAFAGLPKSLDFLSSIYLDFHKYWKEERKEASDIKDDYMFWEYNCKDACITYALREPLENTLRKHGLMNVFEFQMRLWKEVVRMELRGMRVDLAYREKLKDEIEEAKKRLEKRIEAIVGKPFNPRSHKQMKEFLIDQKGLKPVKSRKTGNLSFGKEVVEKYKKQAPELAEFFDAIEMVRRLTTYRSTYLDAELDPDGRFRTSLDICGTETYRFSSRANVWGRGGNLQNIPRPSEDMPNLRNLFIPDDGWILVDMDLDRADAQVVAWEADDEELKQMFREGVDIHAENAKVLGCTRSQAKQAVHATNYGVGPRTMASILGITVKQAEEFRKRWFEAHPKIKEWHRRVERELQTTRQVRNKFGYRRMFLGRIDGKLPEAIAWIPQSTVACVINRALVNIATTFPTSEVQVLLQVHDSLVMQVRNTDILPRVKRAALVKVPYDDPLIIPVSFKVSKRGWGEAEEVEVA